MNSISVSRGYDIKRRPSAVAADKGYSYRFIRRWLRQKGLRAVIPQRTDQLARHKGRPIKFDKEAYKQRNVVERCLGWLKEFRRLSTRYEKQAVNFLAMLRLGCIRLILRKLCRLFNTA